MAFAQRFLQEFRQQGLSICGHLPVCVGHSGHAQTGRAVCMASCPTAEPTAGPQTKRPAGHLPWLTLHPSVLPASRGCIHHHLTQSGYVQSEHPYLELTNVLAQTQSSSLERLTGALGTGFPSWLSRFLESCGSFSAPGGDRA